MKGHQGIHKNLVPWLLLALALSAGCESTDDGGSSWSGGSYYGTGFYDPWYYGGYYDHDDIVVTPPDGRPERPVRPAQPIYVPSGTRPSQSPSIPSTPRAAPRGGGGGRR